MARALQRPLLSPETAKSSRLLGFCAQFVSAGAPVAVGPSSAFNSGRRPSARRFVIARKGYHAGGKGSKSEPPKTANYFLGAVIFRGRLQIFQKLISAAFFGLARPSTHDATGF
jgi:hypothetical protein